MYYGTIGHTHSTYILTHKTGALVAFSFSERSSVVVQSTTTRLYQDRKIPLVKSPRAQMPPSPVDRWSSTREQRGRSSRGRLAWVAVASPPPLFSCCPHGDPCATTASSRASPSRSPDTQRGGTDKMERETASSVSYADRRRIGKSVNW